MAINERSLIVGTLGAGVLALAGCGGAAISPQLSGARAVIEEARVGSAAQFEPDELLVAQRTLDVAEAQPDGSPQEMHYAYLAERQARVAMANARRHVVEEGIEHDESEYRAEIMRVARERGEDLAETERQLAQRERMIERQQQELAERDRRLAMEEQARRDAEANARAAMQRVAEVANVRQDATATVITLSGEVLFESGSATLRPTSRSRLSAVAAALRATPNQSAVVAGYTDSRGAEDRNMRLSEERAEAVREFLVAQGVPDQSLLSEGRGETMPIAANDSAEGRANNRRVEIIIQPASTTTPREGMQQDMPRGAMQQDMPRGAMQQDMPREGMQQDMQHEDMQHEGMQHDGMPRQVPPSSATPPRETAPRPLPPSSTRPQSETTPQTDTDATPEIRPITTTPGDATAPRARPEDTNAPSAERDTNPRSPSRPPPSTPPSTTIPTIPPPATTIPPSTPPSTTPVEQDDTDTAPRRRRTTTPPSTLPPLTPPEAPLAPEAAPVPPAVP